MPVYFTIMAAVAVVLMWKFLGKANKIGEDTNSPLELTRNRLAYLSNMIVGYTFLILAINLALLAMPPWAWKQSWFVVFNLLFGATSLVSTWRDYGGVSDKARGIKRIRYYDG